jgi:hypothetical protein
MAEYSPEEAQRYLDRGVVVVVFPIASTKKKMADC